MSVSSRKFVYIWLLIASISNVAFSQLTSCANNPCKNGGVCVVTSMTSAMCACAGSGYTGTYCETRKLKCLIFIWKIEWFKIITLVFYTFWELFEETMFLRLFQIKFYFIYNK